MHVYAIINTVSLWAIPSLIAVILIFGLVKQVPVYESFVEGAKEGFGTAINIIPHLVGMMVAVSIFRESGALDFILDLLAPILNVLNIPAEIAPLAMIRPISGTGALAITTDIMEHYGPDSLLGRMASTMQGSTDTTLYVLTVYFGAVGVKKIGYALKLGLMADLAGALAAVVIVMIVFS